MTTGWTASVACARARYRKLIASAFCAALAASASAAEIKAAAAERSLDVLVAVFAANAEKLDVARAEAELIAMGGSAVKPLVVLSASPAFEARVLALFDRMGGKASDALLDLLDDKRLRRRSAKLLARTGRNAAEHTRRLLKCIESERDVRHFCGAALVAAMNPAEHRWVGRLTDTLKSDNRDQRLYAAKALNRIGLKTPGVRDALASAAADKDPEVRKIAMDGLLPEKKRKGGKG